MKDAKKVEEELRKQLRDYQEVDMDIHRGLQIIDLTMKLISIYPYSVYQKIIYLLIFRLKKYSILIS